MDFIAVKIEVDTAFSEILIAELAQIGFESFVETEQGVDAFIQDSLFEENELKSLQQKYEPQVRIHYTFEQTEQKNWNEEWEKSYHPIRIGNSCIVRASFHSIAESYPYEIIINPKMSFGTGHHETTALMLENQLEISHQEKQVLDVGCGTGILSIMACKLGAAALDAFDTDEWAVENTKENFEINHCQQTSVQQGTIKEVVLQEAYQIILANINRNVLLQEIPAYASLLGMDGCLLLSGFYERDIAEIEKIAVAQQLIKKNQKVKNEWASLVFQK
ncbi:50S ribosomal protein L11 methyltransferase [Rhodocytophaga rosea]|uniref:Ribosomal protein L11 methyltransferase n=1 Tax=Rhodocytophaga rosea TaxID=2704465 RepID=A0A6C0GSG9_9BACT|nr:50S ribosomal protein L11 methyltransferase [Rhodocytophaga rosea]QHT70472.1 50S ribosomal protein L11 methyltransferase [Rhodocytophaga rosea]